MRQFAVAALLSLASTSAFAQADNSLTFEAVSIKPFPEGAPMRMSGCEGGPGYTDPGQIHCEHITLRMLMARAYKVRTQEIFGPGTLDSEYFNILAKVPPGSTNEEVAIMFRKMLAERFKLTLHHENRLLPAYSLQVATGGPKLKDAGPIPQDDSPPADGKLPVGEDGFPLLRRSVTSKGPITLFRNGQARLFASQGKLAALATAFSNQLERVVVDETGLAGTYDIVLTWTPDSRDPGGRPRPEAASSEASTPEVDLFAALEQQLGLKLVSTRIQHDALVVDRVEKSPTEN